MEMKKKKEKENYMFAEERRQDIVRYVTEANRVTVEELCDHFQVSPATMRNDLRILDRKRSLSRTHGGAIANRQVYFDPPALVKSEYNLQRKQLVARQALKYIHNGDCIALDCGTTAYELALLLGSFQRLHVITSNLSAASYLDLNTDFSLFVIGGEVRKGHHYMLGQPNLEFLSRMNVDSFFMATNSLHAEKGATTPDLATAQIKAAMMENSRKRILLTDSTKLGNVSFVKFADVKDLDIVITDSSADPKIVEEIRRQGVTVDVVHMIKKTN